MFPTGFLLLALVDTASSAYITYGSPRSAAHGDCSDYAHVHGAEKVFVYRPSSEIMLGVVLPITQKGSNNMCVYKSTAGLQTLEALLYAIDSLDQSELPFTLGAVVLDSCQEIGVAMENTVKLAMPIVLTSSGKYYNCSTSEVPQKHTNLAAIWSVIGLIGSESTEETLRMSYVLEMFRLPHVT